MQGDTFIRNQTNNTPQTDDNFFLQSDYYAINNNSRTPNRHLNDYDSNILKEDAYKDISDDIFKLEYQISKYEEGIKSLDMQIQAARDIHDFELAESLFEKRKELASELQTLSAMYKKASLSAKISGGVTSKIKGQLNQNGIVGYIENLISKLPFKFKSIIEIKNSLERLP